MGARQHQLKAYLQRGYALIDSQHLHSNSVPTLTESDLDAFAKLRIPASLLAEAGVRRVTDAEARRDFGIVGSPSMDMAGVVFPYYSHVTGRRTTARLRRDHPEIDAETGKPKNKYLKPFGDGLHLFFPPNAAAKLGEAEMPLALVESEKASLAVTAWASRVGIEMLAVALGGIWGWHGRVGKADAPDGARVDIKGPLPDLDVCNGRLIYIILDSNVATNPKVRQAEKALVTLLAERGCEVRICRLPQLEGLNGPDDLLALCGDDAMRLALTAPARSDDGVGILEAAMEGIAGEAFASNEERFFAFCKCLQRLRGDKAVVLPVEQIGKLLGLHHTLIASYRRRGVAQGWLTQQAKAVWDPRAGFRRAASFRVRLPDGILTNENRGILTNENQSFLNKDIHMGKDGENLPPSLNENRANALSEKTSESLSEKTITQLSENAQIHAAKINNSEIPVNTSDLEKPISHGDSSYSWGSAKPTKSDGMDFTVEEQEERLRI